MCVWEVTSIHFQKDTYAYCSWFDGMEPNDLHMCENLRQSDM